MTDPKWFVNGVETDYFDIYPISATINQLKLTIKNNIIEVDCTNGNITINGEVTEPTNSTDTYEPLYLRRTRGERYDRALKKVVPNFAGWLIGWTATRVDLEKHVKAIWVNPDGTYEWQDHK